MKSASTRGEGDWEHIEGVLAAVFDICDNAFVTYDRSGRIRAAGRRLRALLDLDEAEWAGLRDFPSLSKILGSRLADGHPAPRPPWVLWSAGNGAGREQLSLAGGARIVERVARPLGEDSQGSFGWVERYRDLTVERDLPARLLQTYKLAALGQMTAGITHELNNPLTTILGYGQLLLDRALEPEALADVRRICQEGERASRIVRSLLLMAREAKVERSATNLNEVVERTLRLCEYGLNKAGIRVELDLDPELPATVLNPIQVPQMVLNLVINSQQAIAEGGRPGRIVLRTRRTGSSVFLQVEDNGPGIARELHRRIFEPFFTTKPVGLGTGLGLSIASSIVEQHDGEIEVSSVPGAGAVFTVRLPLVRAPEAPTTVQREDHVPGPSAGSRILVVEEEGGVGQMIAEALAGDGHQVELLSDRGGSSEADGSGALARLETGAFDLVICESKLSEPGAEALRRAMASFEAARHGRILSISSELSGGASFDSFPDRAYPRLLKPFLLSELRAAVSRIRDAGAQGAEAG